MTSGKMILLLLMLLISSNLTWICNFIMPIEQGPRIVIGIMTFASWLTTAATIIITLIVPFMELIESSWNGDKK